jgi:hypothetical protein
MKKFAFLFTMMMLVASLTFIVTEDAYLRHARDRYCRERPNCTHCSFLEDYERGISFYGIDHGQKYRIRKISKVEAGPEKEAR